MAAKIKQELSADIVLIPGSNGVFDVVVDDQLIYSKFNTGVFPDEDQLVSEIACL